ncbi:MAG: DUF559 domain-containing protein [Arachnia sp.]
MHSALHDALAADGILSRRLHPQLIGRIDAAVKRGELTPLLPGTYAPTSDFHHLVLAVADWDADAVFTAGTAARLSWWPDLADDLVHAVTRRRPRRSVAGTRLSLRPMPEPLIVETRGLRIQNPAASTLDLARTAGPDTIDEALRRRATTLGSLYDAFELMSWRPGNPKLASWLRASRDGAWSPLEREAHELLRQGRITGWKANYLIRTGGRAYFADVAFPGLRLVLEFDGWRYHGDRLSFIADRQRDVALRLAGWTVLRFTAETMGTLMPVLRRLLAKVA